MPRRRAASRRFPPVFRRASSSRAGVTSTIGVRPPRGSVAGRSICERPQSARKSVGPSTGPSPKTAACSTACFSSLTLPGNG